MNQNEYILNQEIKNRRILLKMYNKQAFKIKKQLFEAYQAQRSTHYLEGLLSSINKEIETLDKFFKEYAKRQTKESYINGVKQADNGFKQLTLFEGVSTSAIAFGNANIEAIKVLAKETYVPLNKLTKTMARDCREYLKREHFESTESMLKNLNRLVDSETLRKLGVEGVSDVVVGNKTWKQGMQNIKEEFLRQSDFKVPYYKKDGTLQRLVPIEEYAKMVTRTTTAHIIREGTKDRILDTFEDDGDLVEVIGESDFPNSPCIPYQGKILSLTGNTPKELTDKLGADYMGLMADAEANHLFHPNCIHTFGVSERIYNLYNGIDDEEKPANEENSEAEKETVEENKKIEDEDKKAIQEVENTLNNYELSRTSINDNITADEIIQNAKNIELTDDVKKYNNLFSKGEDLHTKALLQNSEYLDKPQVLNARSFDKLGDDYIKVYRGVNSTDTKTASEINEQYRTGKAYIGKGISSYSGGTYTTKHLETAKGYGKDDIIEIAFSKNARIINLKDIDEKKKEIIKEVNKPFTNINSVTKSLALNKGGIAKSMGYDIIQVDYEEWRKWFGNAQENYEKFGEDFKSPYYIILNRKSTIAKAKQ